MQAFLRHLTLEAPLKVRIHVAADERYELFLDGHRIGRGNERGDRFNWYYETYDLDLAAGEHTLVARTWWLNKFGPAPFAQISIRPAFVLAAEGDHGDLFHTGVAEWQVKVLSGYKHQRPSMTWFTGSKIIISGKDFDWGYERGEGPGWSAPAVIDFAHDSNQLVDQPVNPILKPATLPAMLETAIHVGIARHVQSLPAVPTGETFVSAADHLPAEAADWNRLLAGNGSLTVPPNSVRRVIVDLDDYYCAYTDVVTSGGAGSMIRSLWAESLFQADRANNAYGHTPIKGNRNEIEGKSFLGDGDTFEPDGGEHRLFNTLWWEAGRYLEIVVSTAAEPLTIESFSLRETHYPYEWKSHFESSDPRLADVIPISQRVIEMCSHETFMDCPYYEQLMYVGDTRLEILATYSWLADDRLPRKALKLYDESRKSPGFTQSRYPSRIQQTIPPFSAWWIGMLHDYMMWKDDAAFVKSMIPGMRGILDAFERFKTADGLYAGPPGWNFIDWVTGWKSGMPLNGGDVGGVSGPLNFKLAWIFKQAAELEDFTGEPELAALYRRRAAALTQIATKAFWNESRGLLADDLTHEHFSEHTQCLALLGENVAGASRSKLISGLMDAPDLAQTTIYFAHYLFETCGLIGRMDRLFDRLGLWFELKPRGFRTTLEQPEPSRSDCHAWGAHPLYHYFATILGIRPATPGFGTVTIKPQLGPLGWAKGSMVHPRGLIDLNVKQDSARLRGNVLLPAGVTGSLVMNGQTVPLASGPTEF
ncbi:hypothetical protein BH10PLA1_BH10PLA1_20700 [soil metagenome]